MEVTDLARVVFARGAVRDASRAAVEVFENDLLTLDNQLTDTACVGATSDDKSSPR